MPSSQNIRTELTLVALLYGQLGRPQFLSSSFKNSSSSAGSTASVSLWAISRPDQSNRSMGVMGVEKVELVGLGVRSVDLPTPAEPSTTILYSRIFVWQGRFLKIN